MGNERRSTCNGSLLCLTRIVTRVMKRVTGVVSLVVWVCGCGVWVVSVSGVDIVTRGVVWACGGLPQRLLHRARRDHRKHSATADAERLLLGAQAPGGLPDRTGM